MYKTNYNQFFCCIAVGLPKEEETNSTHTTNPTQPQQQLTKQKQKNGQQPNQQQKSDGTAKAKPSDPTKGEEK
jgi:hypothetical protein